MEQFFGVLILLIIIFYLLRAILVPLMPRFLMWLMRRQVNRQMRDAFGDNFDRKSQRRQKRQQAQHQQNRKGKIFSKDVGEYVDFEEVAVHQTDTYTEASHIKYTEESQISDADWEDL